MIEFSLYQQHKYDIRKGPVALKAMERIVREVNVGRLAFNGNDYPYVIPMNHYYENGKFYWHCAFGGKKADLMGNNPKACYVVDGPIKPMRRKEKYYHNPWYSIVCYGQVDMIADVEERLRVLRLYSEFYGGPQVQIARAKTCNIMRFNIDYFTLRYGRFTPAENRHLYVYEFNQD